MISIFARPSYLGNLYPKHTKETNTHRLSSRIRGEEIAKYGGFKLNPKNGYENDVLIYVKPTGLNHIPDGAFVDVLDGLRRGREKLLKDRPGIKVIAASKNSFYTLRKELPNKVTCIPHHHINFDNLKRTRKVINTCGYIGSPSPTAFKIYKNLGKEIRKLGMKWITCFDYKTRKDAIKFYKKIDILVIGIWNDDNPHKLPTKIINAMSFGIPTIAFPLLGYSEIEEYYLRAFDIENYKDGINQLRDKEYYKWFSDKIIERAKSYHISRIVDFYNKLT